MGIGVFCATAIAYLPALRGAFIWNDSDYVTQAGLRPLAGLGRIWTELGATQQYYPVLHSAFWVQHRLFGDNPAGYHAVNLLLHLGAALLFALALRRLMVPGAWLAALLFALHPVHVQSVAWITEQKNTLSLVCYLAAFLAYLRFDETRKPRSYLVALALFVISLLSKTSTATLPAALLVVLWWQRGRLDWRRDARPLMPWLAIGAGAGIFVSWVERHYLGAQGADFDLPLLERGLVAGRAIWFYLGSLVWPFELNFVYRRWAVDAAVWWHWLFPLGVLAGLAGLWRLRRRTRTPLAVALLFAGTLFPVLGFVNLYGTLFSWVWDHWQYPADLAPLALAGAGLGRLGRGTAPRLGRLGGRALATTLFVLLGVLTWRRCGDFRDDRTLYRTTLARNPECWMAHDNLGVLLAAQPGRLPEAIDEFEAALRIKDDVAEPHFNLGTVLARIPGRMPDAITAFETALRISPDYVVAHLNLGNALARYPGRRTEAIAQYEAVLRLAPRMAEVHLNLGNVLAHIPGRETEAMAHYASALRINPGLAEAYDNWGTMLSRMPGHEQAALAKYDAALRLNPDDAGAHVNRGNILANLPGRLPEAVADYAAAIRLNPGLVLAHYDLGLALMDLPERQPEAIEALAAALRLQPDFAQAHYKLGEVLLRSPGRRAEALAQFEEALRLRPDSADARAMVERLRDPP